MAELSTLGSVIKTAYEAEAGVREGTSILSTGEAGGTKFLREDGDGTCSWQAVSGTGDFLANGTVDMTGEFRTDVGTFDSDVADGASANAYVFNTANTYSTAGANLLRLQNNGTNVFDFSYQGGIDHVNSGASTAAHSQSLNMNWAASGAQTSSGQYSAVIGSNNTAAGIRSFVGGYNNNATSTASESIVHGYSNTSNSTYGLMIGQSNSSNTGTLGSATFGFQADVRRTASVTMGGGNGSQVGFTAAYAITSDATQTDMSLYGSNRINITPDTTTAFIALVVGRSNEADGNDSAAYRLDGVIARDESGNTAIVGSVTKTVIAESAGATAWDVTAEADDTNDVLAIKVTGEAGTTIKWSAKIDTADITLA